MRESLSARRAWIEIGSPATDVNSDSSRSPQGERGLKFGDEQSSATALSVALRKESVD